MAAEIFDVVVVGAGISGIDTACNLRQRCPDHSFVLLERRATFGGTWDLFKYPGIRSDSDMYTFGFDFRPWNSAKPIAVKEDIREYLQGAIADGGLRDYIRFGHHVIRAAWSSATARWSLECENGSRFECRFLVGCAGYYDHDRGHEPEFVGSEDFTAAGGAIVHPQKWTDDVVYKGKKVVVIGSGATAVTLIPAIAEEAAHVTMLQRSPTYIVWLPNLDETAKQAMNDGCSPEELHRRVRDKKAKEMDLGLWTGALGMTPETLNKTVIGAMRLAMSKKHMSDEDFAKHFTPRYNVWEQRLCVCPDGDFFSALKSKKASIVTDEIERFDSKGIRLKSGDRVDADLIVTATGLRLQDNAPMATMQVTVDGVPYRARDHFVYKGCMLDGVPNFVFIQGYFQASWTLKADLVAQYVCRMLRHMQDSRGSIVSVKLPSERLDVMELNFSSGYVMRSKDRLPKNATVEPWSPMISFAQDRKVLIDEPLSDGVLQVTGSVQPASKL